MCLSVELDTRKKNKLVFKKAEEDITCYKVLIKGKTRFDETEAYYTPYMEMKVMFNRRYDDEMCPFSMQTGRVFKVVGGVFHLFKNLDEAITEADDWSSSIVVEAVIPKGAEYVDGTFRYGDVTRDSCGTRSVIYKKQVWPVLD